MATSAAARMPRPTCRPTAGSQVHGVVYRERLQAEHGADGERQAARQAHAHERRAATRAAGRKPSAQLRPQLEPRAPDQIDRRPAE